MPSFTYEGAPVRVMRVQGQRFHCPVEGCKYHLHSSLKTKRTLQRHMGRVHSAKTFTCSQPGCARSFALKSDLATHAKHCGSIIACLECGMLFSTASGLKRHYLRSGHLELGPSDSRRQRVAAQASNSATSATSVATDMPRQVQAQHRSMATQSTRRQVATAHAGTSPMYELPLSSPLPSLSMAALALDSPVRSTARSTAATDTSDLLWIQPAHPAHPAASAATDTSDLAMHSVTAHTSSAGTDTADLFATMMSAEATDTHDLDMGLDGVGVGVGCGTDDLVASAYTDTADLLSTANEGTDTYDLFTGFGTSSAGTDTRDLYAALETATEGTDTDDLLATMGLGLGESEAAAGVAAGTDTLDLLAVAGSHMDATTGTDSAADMVHRGTSPCDLSELLGAWQ